MLCCELQCACEAPSVVVLCLSSPIQKRGTDLSGNSQRSTAKPSAQISRSVVKNSGRETCSTYEARSSPVFCLISWGALVIVRFKTELIQDEEDKRNDRETEAYIWETARRGSQFFAVVVTYLCVFQEAKENSREDEKNRRRARTRRGKGKSEADHTVHEPD